jgi:hypothetical protein
MLQAQVAWKERLLRERVLDEEAMGGKVGVLDSLEI